MTNGVLPGDTLVTRTVGSLSAELGNEAVVLDVDADAYFGLDDIGARIWRLLSEPHTVDALVAQLCGEFDVAPEVCRADVMRFVQELHDASLVTLGTHPDDGP